MSLLTHESLGLDNVIGNETTQERMVRESVRLSQSHHNQIYGLPSYGALSNLGAGQIAYGQAIFNARAEMMKAQGELYSEMARSGTLRGKAGPIKTAEDKPINPKLFISGKHNFMSRQYER